MAKLGCGAKSRNRFRFGRGLVRIAGLEPARVAPLPPQSSVSANSTICAQGWDNEPAVSPNRKGKLILWPVASPLECSVTREFGNQGFFAFGEGSGSGGLAAGAFVFAGLNAERSSQWRLRP